MQLLRQVRRKGGKREREREREVANDLFTCTANKRHYLVVMDRGIPLSGVVKGNSC